MIDRYTYYNLEFLERNVDITSQHTMKDLFDSYDRNLIHSTPGVRTDLFRRRLDEVKITDFFGNVQSVEIDGEREVIDEELLSEQNLSSDITPTEEGVLGKVNSTVAVPKRETLHMRNHRFEVKLQDGNAWIKKAAVIACILLWIAAKRI